MQKMIAKLSGSDEVQTEDSPEEGLPAAYTQTMRIALLDGDADIYREGGQIRSTQGMSVLEGNVTREFGPQEVFAFSVGDAENGTICITPKDGELLLADSSGTWSNGYEGRLELHRCEKGFVVVNEIDLEHYLKRVVPSEMPRSYGAEALRAQAICARTYAYAHSNVYAYPEVNAQMDDSTSFQVYNQSRETEETNRAVSDTAGMILTSRGNLIDALYYSTSCGYGQDGSLFNDKLDVSILPCMYIGSRDPGTPFETYIRQEDPAAYEAQERYFRWTTVLDPEQVSGMRHILVSYLSKEDVIEVNDKFKKRLTDASCEDGKAMGTLEKIEVAKRNAGGAAEQVKLTFSTGTAVIQGQLNVRDILGVLTTKAALHNGEEVATGGRLPSAAIAIEKRGDGSFFVYGGGYGHGVGMSQNGAKDLAAIGYDYKDILTFFYRNTKITMITER